VAGIIEMFKGKIKPTEDDLKNFEDESANDFEDESTDEPK
jgi:hypothetical protein